MIIEKCYNSFKLIQQTFFQIVPRPGLVNSGEAIVHDQIEPAGLLRIIGLKGKKDTGQEGFEEIFPVVQIPFLMFRNPIQKSGKLLAGVIKFSGSETLGDFPPFTPQIAVYPMSVPSGNSNPKLVLDYDRGSKTQSSIDKGQNSKETSLK